MQKGSYANLVPAERANFAEIIERYIVEVLPTMRGGKARIRAANLNKS